MPASRNSDVFQQAEALENAPGRSTLPDATSPALYPTLLLLCLAGTCMCLIMAYFMKSFRRCNKNGEEEVSAQAETSSPLAKLKYPMVVDPGEYFRPLGSIETLMAVGGKLGSFNTVQVLWLGSMEPINPSDVLKAVSHVAEKTLILQLSIEWCGLRPWFRRMKEVVLDFEVEDDEVSSVTHDQVHRTYDFKKGPLWSVRLVPIKKQNSTYSHQAALIVSVFHCITDGYTNMQICKDIMTVLNASLSGKVHELPLRPVFPAVSDSLKSKGSWFHGIKYTLGKFYASAIYNSSKLVYLDGVIEQPRTNIALTKFLREDYTAEETKELLRHCREHGVRMHSCIMATANLAFLKTAQKKAKHKIDKALLNSMFSTNMRRYFPDDCQEATGCHISVVERETLISGSAAESKENFWSLVRTFQSNLNESLEVLQTPIRLVPILRNYTIMFYLNHELTRRGLKNRADSAFACTNMGNLKTMLPAKYDGPIVITDLLRSGSCDVAGTLCTLVCHTFDDRFALSLDYYTNKMTDDTAAHYFSILSQYIRDIARYGTVKEPAAAR